MDVFSKASLKPGAIGIFDSGYGGLTILSDIQKLLPEYNFIYLGDNSRAPYGSRSFDVVYEFTKQAVIALFNKGCNLVILACNTASAKALRSIQQFDLPLINSNKRVLGIIRPTAEIIGNLTQTRHIGIVGTLGTIQSESYILEIEKIYPDIVVNSLACPMWVPIVENGEFNSEGADFFVKRDLDILFSKDNLIDSLILGCTHYPLLMNKVKKHVPKHIKIISQGEHIARSLKDYLKRHPEIDNNCVKDGITSYNTTEQPKKFRDTATLFLNKQIKVEHISID